MKRQQRNLLVVGGMISILYILVMAVLSIWSPPSKSAPIVAVNPVLSVVAISPKLATLPISISANGNIVAWQEASIGNECNGLRLADVLVDVGDKVEREQILATFVIDTVSAEWAQSQASVSEANAVLAEARINATRARDLQASKALSTQQVQQYITAEQTALARLQVAEAIQKTKQVQVTQTQVRAPDDGVISARNVAVGTVPSVGDELFRLIRQGRLEWRAEVTASDLAKLTPGQLANIRLADNRYVQGKLRIVAPVIDMQTRNALVYVDLPNNTSAVAGMFAHGSFVVDNIEALTLPQNAVLLHDGFSYVFSIEADAKVTQTKVTLGRRFGGLVEILDGIEPSARIVANGAGFLGDGDLVRVIADEPVEDHNWDAKDRVHYEF